MIESVPNVSEGVRSTVVDAFAAAIDATPHVLLLNHSADPSHNRSVYTCAGDGARVVDALLSLVRIAVEQIDMRQHHGAHPRIGAVDVVPFIPLSGSSIDECVALSRTFARTVAERFSIPVFLYERSASVPHRQRLEEIRRGQFEGLADKLTLPDWQPDFGPSHPHPTAGAMVTGARMPLIAFNINLTTDRVDVASAIARVIRERNGGLPCVKALGLFLPHLGIAQVSMNLTDYTRTPVQAVFDAVEREAHARGVGVLESELIGLIPADALAGTSADRLKLTGFSPERVLEHAIALRTQKF